MIAIAGEASRITSGQVTDHLSPVRTFMTARAVPSSRAEVTSSQISTSGRVRPSFGVTMIGAGVRTIPEHTLLSERLINVLATAAPGIRFCFNTSPETTIDAIR
ncbi:hypothetical protein ABZ815_51285 [Nonomuraea sp. NPDC047529]|uniref:hypothetical protein n=1 Tax=Nonomuraea sp. NPDC047529 TaxID=3155623 RepID=UPI0033E0D8DC